MPAGRAARPRRPPFQPGQAATSGRAGARPAAPSRAPGPAECVAAPAGGYFEREGSGPASVFLAFSWPPARQPGPSAARGVGGGVTWRGEGEGRRDPAGAQARAQAREAPGGGPDLRSRLRLRPSPSGGIINSAPGSGSGSRAPATCTPLLPRASAARALPPQRRTQASLDSAAGHRWPITGLDFFTCKLGMSYLALHGGYQIKVLLAVCLSLAKTPSLFLGGGGLSFSFIK